MTMEANGTWREHVLGKCPQQHLDRRTLQDLISPTVDPLNRARSRMIGGQVIERRQFLRLDHERRSIGRVVCNQRLVTTERNRAATMEWQMVYYWKFYNKMQTGIAYLVI